MPRGEAHDMKEGTQIGWRQRPQLPQEGPQLRRLARSRPSRRSFAEQLADRQAEHVRHPTERLGPRGALAAL